MNVEELIEVVSHDRLKLIKLKNCLAAIGEYEWCAKVREVEKEKYPETEYVKEQKDKAQKLKSLLSTVGISTSDKLAWVLNETILLYKKKKGKFSVKDSADITFEADKIFIE